MIQTYMAIWYQCNQHCTGCPCTRNTGTRKSMSFDEISSYLNRIITFARGDQISVTLSGGEPTLHPDFLPIISLLSEKGIKLTLLTNAEKFSDRAFSDEFLNAASILNTHVVTTIHSSKSTIHEEQNHSIGSFQKSIEGLQYLFHRGIQITIKHCVTRKNYEDTKAFVQFINNIFHPFVNIEIWGIDYCGLNRSDASQLYAPYLEMQPFLEEALDECILANSKNGRITTLKNIPLCSVDPYYWQMFQFKKRSGTYNMYFDPETECNDMDDGAGTYSSECIKCAANHICPGTYKSAFDYFGDNIVKAVLPAE